ncbi:hypothetical protein MWU59_10670 [Flavobacteriaceae bacterium F08102]|nr:hypothetical protein [Flavobacteriaceae bacterium F08102]
MIRKIVDYKKLNEDILNLLVEKYPYGYDDSDIITFRNANNEVVEAVEVKTDEVVYLVKVGQRLIQAIQDHSDEEDDDIVVVDSADDKELDLEVDDIDLDDSEK